MCRQNYDAQFDHSKNICPNIIPYEEDIKIHPRYGNMKYMPVNIKYSKGNFVHHDSLVHMWNEWYKQYVDAEFPRLIVRLEDLLFQGEEVISRIYTCAGQEMRSGAFSHQARMMNVNHGIERKGTKGLLSSLIRYGNYSNRNLGYPPFQLKAAEDLLAKDLMDFFGYRYEPVPGS
jgi:hypothetical protein